MRSWAGIYIVWLLMILVGVAYAEVNNSGINEETSTLCRKLLADGKRAPGRVTRRWSGGGEFSYQTIEYSYLVDGKTYEGSEDPGIENFIRLPVNSEITVYYLPQEPDTSYYDPQRWLEEKDSERQTGRGISLFGALALVGSAAMDVRRKRRRVPIPELPPGHRRYVMSGYAFAFGLLFFVFGLAFQLKAISDLVRGAMVPVTVSVNDAVVSQHFAGPLERAVFCLFPVISWGLGLLILLYSKHYWVETTPDELLVNRWRKQLWRGRWEDLKITKKENRRVSVSNGSETILIECAMTDFEDLEKELSGRIPNWNSVSE